MTARTRPTGDPQAALFTTHPPPNPNPRDTTGRPDHWLTDHLIANGHLDPTGLGRRAIPTTCPRCHHLILRGYDHDTCALEARVDPTPLTTLGEALARIEGRYTVDLAKTAGRYVLERRDVDHITRFTAGQTPRHDVLREHRCHTPTPSPQLVAASQHRPVHRGGRWNGPLHPNF